MGLDPNYLSYPERGLGMDHTLYPWSNLFERKPIAWPQGASVATPVVVSLEWFPITPIDNSFRAPGHMQTAYPDYRHYTSRDYGSRVGIYRLFDAFDKAGVQATIALNSAIAERYPMLVRDIVAAGHGIVAHSVDMNGTIATGLPEKNEAALIATSLDTIERATRRRPTGWLSIARSQSWNTPALLAAYRVGHMLDWVNDELPYRMTTSAGEIVNLPLNHELSDRQVIGTQQQSMDSYAQQLEDAWTCLDGEARRFGGRMLPIHVTPYIVGLPYRIERFERLLQDFASRSGNWFASTEAIVAVVTPFLAPVGRIGATG